MAVVVALAVVALAVVVLVAAFAAVLVAVLVAVLATGASSSATGLAADLVVFAAAFFAEAVAVRRVVVAATARDAVTASRVTVMPCSSSERSTTFIRFGGTSAPSSASRRAPLSTEPLVRPCMSSCCRAGWVNSVGRDGAGLAVFLDTGDTDYLSSRDRGTAHAIAGMAAHAYDNNYGGGSIAETGRDVPSATSFWTL